MKQLVYIAFVLGVLMPIVGMAQSVHNESAKSLEFDGPISTKDQINLEASEYISFEQEFSYRADENNDDKFLKARINKSKSFDINDYYDGYANDDFDSITIDTDRPVGLTAGGHSVDLSGAANYNIPIQIPSGTNGMVPSISINYNSNAGSGAVGYGWNISGLSAISRSGDNMFYDGHVSAVELNSGDHFVLDGNRLIPLEGKNGQNDTKYGTKSRSFSEITSYTISTGPEWFKVFTKDRVTIEFGRTVDSKLMAEDNTTAILWMVNKITDVYGNYVTFSYKQLGGQVAIEKIEYTGNQIANLDPYNKIEFFYDQREDSSFAYVGGDKIEINALLRRIEISTNGIIYKQYQFDYSKLLYSMLKEVTEIDAGGKKLNSTKIKYHDQDHSGIPTVNLGEERYQLPENDLDNMNITYFPGDFNGDGLADLLGVKYRMPFEGVVAAHYKTWEIFINDNKNGGKGFIPKGVNNVPLFMYKNGFLSPYTTGSNNMLDNVKIYIADLNGDLKDDIIVSSRGTTTTSQNDHRDNIYYRAYLSNGNGFTWSDETVKMAAKNDELNHAFTFGDFDGDGIQEMFFFDSKEEVCSITSFDGRINLTEPYIISDILISSLAASTVDYNGDGRAEVLLDYLAQNVGNHQDENFRNYINLQIEDDKESFSPVANITSEGIGASDKTLAEYKEPRIVDFNGDGKTDFVQFYEDHQEVWLGNGIANEFDENSFEIIESDDWLNLLGDEKAFFIDLNADGRTDALYRYGTGALNRFYILLSSGNGKFKVELREVPRSKVVLSLATSFSFGDIDGDGLPELIAKNFGNGRINFIHLNVGDSAIQRRVATIKDGFLNEVKFDYATLTQEENYTNGEEGEYPLNDFQGAQWVVKNVTTPDGIGGELIDEYSYEGATLDREGNGLLGFSRIIHRNQVLNFEKTTDLELFQYVKRYRVKIPTSTLITNYDSTITLSGSSVVYDFRRWSYERYGMQLTESANINYQIEATTISKYQYDIVGNIIEVEKNINSTETAITKTTYGEEGTQEQRMPQSVVVKVYRSGKDTITKKVNYDYYDNATVNLKSVVINPDEDPSREHSLYLKNTFTYDVFGNELTNSITSSAEDATTEMVFDEAGRFAIESINTLGQSSYASYHPYWGAPISSTNILGHVTTSKQDDLGQLLSARDAHGHESMVERTWDFSENSGLNSPISDANTVYSILSKGAEQPTDKAWYDAFGRQRKSTIEGLNGLVFQVMAYNAKGNNHKSTNPFFDDGSTPYVNSKSYDEINRIDTSIVGPDTTTYQYSLGRSLYTTVISSDRGTRTVITNPMGRVLSSNDEGGTLAYEYNSNGKQTKVFLNFQLVATMEYDANGNQTKLVDINAGTIDYTYNALNQLEIQVENGNAKRLVYDKVGRVLTNTNDDGVITYTYVTEGNGLNQLKKEEESENGYTNEYVYDDFSRLVVMTEHVGAEVFTSQFEFDEFDRQVARTYPSGIKAESAYNNKGYLISKTLEGIEVFKSLEINEYGQLTAYENSLNSVDMSYTAYGVLKSKKVGNDYNMQYQFDEKTGNLNWRKDGVIGLTEDFVFDELNRLEYAKVESVSEALSLDYAPNGNIDFKSDAGDYTYHTEKINAVTEIAGDFPLPQQNITYNANKRTTTIEQDDHFVSFKYGTGNQRKKAVTKLFNVAVQTKYYGSNYEKILEGESVTEITYVEGPDGLLGMWVAEDDDANWYYTNTDYLGSILQLVDENNEVIAEQNFDAWGRYRNTEEWTYEDVAEDNPTWLTRGYTGHEHLNQFGLINMNARLYDARVARMLGTDNYIQNPIGTQGYNRYSYVHNNPLSYTDPSGESLVGIGIGIVTGGYQGYQIGKAKGATGRKLFGYTIAGAAIGGVSSWAGGALVKGVGQQSFLGSTLVGSALGGAAGGGISGAGFALLAGNDVEEGFWDGAISGFAGGLAGGYIAGGEGAFLGGALSSAIGTARKDGSKKEIGMAALMGGLTGLGSYQLQQGVAYLNYKKLGGTWTYKEYAWVSTYAQRSFSREREVALQIKNIGKLKFDKWGPKYGENGGEVAQNFNPTDRDVIHTHAFRSAGYSPEDHIQNETFLMADRATFLRFTVVSKKNIQYMSSSSYGIVRVGPFTTPYFTYFFGENK
ncbi:MAG: VCBS repeat-containing protein [Flavobacteriales bacterium]|nr:VCBS repeat-containing protein [Flavobacteriales bacterium]